MNIAILGSSFDPPHNGHLKIAKYVLKSKKIHKIILMPTNIHPFAKELTSAHHRLTMTKFLEDKNIEVSDFEVKRNSISYSIQTLKSLQAQFPKDKFYWIIGSDNIGNFTKWKDWQKIISDFGLITIARDLQTDIARELNKIINTNNLNKNIIILKAKDFPPLDISSSKIRERIHMGKSIKNLVPKTVERYIIKHRLYM